jgi:hypothetical protein
MKWLLMGSGIAITLLAIIGTFYDLKNTKYLSPSSVPYRIIDVIVFSTGIILLISTLSM